MSKDWRVARVMFTGPKPWVWLVNWHDPDVQARMSVEAWERQK